MSFDAAETAIRTRFKTNWTGTPIAWENVKFDPMDETAMSPFAVGTPWVFFELLWGGAQPISTGEPVLSRATGVVQVHCYVPVTVGRAPGVRLADAAAVIFRNQSFTDANGRQLRFRTPYPLPNAAATGDWFVVTMAVAFQFDDLG